MTEKVEDFVKSRIYARQQLIDGWDQDVINNGCILIIGVGALRIL